MKALILTVTETFAIVALFAYMIVNKDPAAAAFTAVTLLSVAAANKARTEQVIRAREDADETPS